MNDCFIEYFLENGDPNTTLFCDNDDSMNASEHSVSAPDMSLDNETDSRKLHIFISFDSFLIKHFYLAHSTASNSTDVFLPQNSRNSTGSKPGIYVFCF